MGIMAFIVFSNRRSIKWVPPSSLTPTSVPWRSRTIFFSTTAANGSFLEIDCNLVGTMTLYQSGSLKGSFKTSICQYNYINRDSSEHD